MTIFDFDDNLGWIINTTLSTEITIPSLEEESFKIFDINNDDLPEILRYTSDQIDILYYDNDCWKVNSNIINSTDYSYLALDMYYDDNIHKSYLITAQINNSNSISLWKYEFISNIEVNNLISVKAPDNFIPTSIHITKGIDNSYSLSVLVAGLMENSYSSQLFKFNSDLSFDKVMFRALHQL